MAVPHPHPGRRSRQPIVGGARRLPLLLLVGGLAIAPVAAQEHAPTSSPAINKMCPVLQDQEADPTITTVYKGRTIAFCCDHCRRKFEADPERYVGHLAAFVEQGSEPTSQSAGTSGREHEIGASTSANGVSHIATEEPQRAPLFARMHPIIVHFPVAGVPLALLAFLVWLITGKPAFAAADVPPLFVAALAAVLAFFSGHLAADHTRFSASMSELVEQHEAAGTTLMIVVLCLAAFRIWRWNGLNGNWRWIYVGGLFIALCVAVVTGYLGGSLVFGPDHFSL